jgi:hypothetical protein
MADKAVEAVLGAVDTAKALQKGIDSTYARLGTTAEEVEAEKAKIRDKRRNNQAKDFAGATTYATIAMGNANVETVVIDAEKKRATRKGN